MNLRIATIDDIDLVMSMIDKFHRSIPLKDYVDEAVVVGLVSTFLSSPLEDKIVIINNDVGLIAGCMQPFMLGVAPMAHEIAWWVEPEYRKSHIGQDLMEAYELWAKKMNAKILCVSCYADNSLGKFYEKNNYRLHELGYIKEL